MGKIQSLWLVIVFVIAAGCGTQNTEEHGHGHGGTAVTRWTERTELFAEFPELVAGEKAAVAIHLTDLSDFSPVTSGAVRVAATSNGMTGFETTIGKASSPGIFRTELLLGTPGTYDLSVVVEATGNDTIRIAHLHVSDPSEHGHHAHGDETGGDISFLKEQQWKTDFRTAPVHRTGISKTIAGFGEITPRGDGEIVVSAPFSGYASAESTLPAPGTTTKKGETLVRFIPAAETQGGSDAFSSRLAAAKAARDVAESQYQRSKTLFDEDLISAKEYIEDKAEWERTEATYKALLNAVDGIDDGSLSRDGVGIRAPITGIVEDVYVVPGKHLQSGDPLFHIVNDRRVWLRTYVKTADAANLDALTLVAFSHSGNQQRTVLNPRNVKRISASPVIDEKTRSIPIIFEIDNSKYRFPIGLTGRVQLATDTKNQGLIVPEGALTEDQGQYYVFVQTGGESFERREVTLGTQFGNAVEITSGLSEGERIVTVGATLVRLAASSSSVPAHGHTH